MTFLSERLEKLRGVSLIEFLFILIIISVVIVTLIGYQTRKTEQFRSDRFALQLKNILNAGMAYYVAKGKWPLSEPYTCSVTSDLSPLQTDQFLPAGIINPWTKGFKIGCESESGQFFVVSQTPTVLEAQIAAGRLPNGFITDEEGQNNFPPTASSACTTTPPDSGCTYVVAKVSVPGQNRMNARTVNFASLYHNGACVPAPFCPPHMKPTIMVMPVSVSGMKPDPGCSSSSCMDITVIPISGYTATAYPETGPVQISSRTDTIRSCSTGEIPCLKKPDVGIDRTPVEPGKYWRVCLSIHTQGGPVNPGSRLAGQLAGSILAITRCEPEKEPTGVDFMVWQK